MLLAAAHKHKCIPAVAASRTHREAGERREGIAAGA